MRICLIGSVQGNIDEGMKKAAFELKSALSKRHEVLLLEPMEAFSRSFCLKLRNFSPQIVHYIPGPSSFSFAVMRWAKSCCMDTRTVMSATHPSFYGFHGFSYGPYYALSTLLRIFVPLFKPDLVLTLSKDTEAKFKKLGCKTEFLPLGVDIERFLPVSADVKEELRQKYNVDAGKFVILHIGHIKRSRNVQLLSRFQEVDNQVIIVGSTSTKAEHDICQQLKGRKCFVWTGYLPNIEQVYALSDCYVFPTQHEVGSIELPLSVLEAMACNLPVISTKFGALTRIFSEDDGLVFVDEETELVRGLERIKSGSIQVKNREKVLPYSWENVAKTLEAIYERLLQT